MLQLKLLKDALSYPIQLLVNYSFSTGSVPDQYKVAIVIPILKKESLDNVFNYRPIFLLSNFNKIIEKLMHN